MMTMRRLRLLQAMRRSRIESRAQANGLSCELQERLDRIDKVLAAYGKNQ